MKGGPLETFNKFAKKILTKPKHPAQKNFGHVPDSNPRPSAWQTSKTVTASSGTAISTDVATRHVQKFCQKFVQI